MSRLSLGWPALLLLAAACGRSEPEQAAPTPTAAVPLLDAGQLGGLVADGRGKVLVVNLWATWCLPCVAEFPELDRFARDHRDRGVEVVAISVDDPRVSDLVERFVAERKPSFRVVQSAAGTEAPFRRILGAPWDGTIPVTFVLDRGGKVVTSLAGQHRRDEFAEAVAPLLARP